MKNSTNYPISLLSLILLVAILSCSTAVADTWTSASGKFKIEASFVQLKDGKIQLKRDDNDKLLWVELAKLSKADQEKANRLAANDSDSSPTKPEGLAQQVEVAVKMELDEHFPNRRAMKFSITATGEPAADAFLYGKFKFKKFLDASGQAVVYEEDTFGFREMSESMETVNRDGPIDHHPKAGVAFDFEIEPEDLPQKLSLIKGEFQLATGGTRSIVKVENIASMINKKVQDKLLKKARIKVAVANPPSSNRGVGIMFVVSGKRETMTSLRVLNEDGEAFEEQTGTGKTTSNGIVDYEFYFAGGELPDGATLYIELVENPETIKVPFEFKNLDVPQPPKKD